LFAEQTTTNASDLDWHQRLAYSEKSVSSPSHKKVQWLCGTGNRAGQHAGLGQEIAHNRVRFAADAATACYAIGDYCNSNFSSLVPASGTTAVSPDVSGLEYFGGIETDGLGILDGSSIADCSTASTVDSGPAQTMATLLLPGGAPSPGAFVPSVNLPSVSVTPIAGLRSPSGIKTTWYPESGCPLKVTIPDAGTLGSSSATGPGSVLQPINATATEKSTTKIDRDIDVNILNPDEFSFGLC
jgi:hypothetical protein